MSKTFALAIRPNQVKFALALSQSNYPGCEVLFCADDAEKYTSQFDRPVTVLNGLNADMNNNTMPYFRVIDHIVQQAEGQPVTLLIPHAMDPQLLNFAHLIRSQGLQTGGLYKYYEGLGSYTTSQETIIAKNHGLWEQTYTDEELWNPDFIGITELDRIFKRDSKFRGLGIDQVFPAVKDADVPEVLKCAKAIFLGQPLFEGGLDTKEAFGMFAWHLHEAGVDLYVPHPRETAHVGNMPPQITVHALPRPIEEYRHALRGKNVFTLFSSAAFALAAAGANIKVVEAVPPAPWRNNQPIIDAYRPLKELFPTVEIKRASVPMPPRSEFAP